MVTFENGLPKKSRYRKFKFRSTESKPDDFKSLQEVVERRYFGKLTETLPMPDLIIIDGGKGQLSSVMEIFESKGLEVDVVSLAKRLEEVFKPHKSEPVITCNGSVFFNKPFCVILISIDISNDTFLMFKKPPQISQNPRRLFDYRSSRK